MAEPTTVAIFITLLLAAIAYFQVDLVLDPDTLPINVPTIHLLSYYDFIVIGAGSAGLFINPYTLIVILTKIDNFAQVPLLQID